LKKVKISQKKHGKWGSVFYLKINPTSIPDYGSMEKWIRNGFQHNFIIIMHFSQMKAGGSFGIGFNSNKSYIPDSVIKTDYMEIRCDKQDANGLLKMQQYLQKNTIKILNIIKNLKIENKVGLKFLINLFHFMILFELADKNKLKETY